MYGPCTRPVYTTRVHDCVRAVCTVVLGRVRGAYTAPYRGRVHGRVRAVTRPCTRHVYGRVHVSTCLRVQGPCTRAIYAAESGRLHGRTRPCNVVYTAVYGRYRPYRLVYTAVYGPCARPFSALYTGLVHWPFSAVYIARTRPSNSPRTQPLHGRVQGPSVRHVGLLGRVHVPRRHATAVCGSLRHTVRVRGRVNGPCRRTCTRLCMGRVHDRVHSAFRPCTRPTAVTCRFGPCTRPCRPTCPVGLYTCTRPPFNCGVDVCTCRTAV